MQNITERAIQFYASSWIDGDRDAVRRMIAPDANIEWNLDLPVDDEELVQTLHRIATRAQSVQVVSQEFAHDRATLVYDCTGAAGSARIAEFITARDGRIASVRQVHDSAAIERCFPGLLDPWQ